MALHLRQKEKRMNIPYRTKKILQRIGMIALVVLLVAALVWLCWFAWLKRYVIYSREDGAVLDFSAPAQLSGGEPALPPAQEETVSIYYNEGENAINTNKELTQLVGYYVDRDALIAGVDQVLQQAKALERGTPVMLEVKSATGNFFYNSAVAEHRDSKVDTAAVDELIRKLDESGTYLIARLPALRDRMYGLNNVNDGVFDTRGAYLFRDEGGCYWLDPTRDKIQSYLMDICTELRILGFDEVVFDEFRFPNTDGIVFSGDRTATLESVAQTLVDTCSTEVFAVSFISDGSWKEPEGRSRVYRQDISDAIKLMEFNNSVSVEEPQTRVGLLTNNMDESFEEYSVLRPIDLALGEE